MYNNYSTVRFKRLKSGILSLSLVSWTHERVKEQRKKVREQNGPLPLLSLGKRNEEEEAREEKKKAGEEGERRDEGEEDERALRGEGFSRGCRSVGVASAFVESAADP